MTSPIRYRTTLLRAAEFRLDAGSMFGLIPRAVWSRTVPTDDRNRVTLQHNCLLLERLGDPSAGSKFPAPKLMLLEAGTGNKLDDKSRDIFAMEKRWVGDALHEVNCRAENIEAAVVSHLHFDHAGGLTRLALPGETPDWTGPASSFAAARPDHAVKRSFPNAAIYTQGREWADALANRSVMTRTYFPDHLLPLKDHVKLLDSSPPYAPGSTPDRDTAPPAPQSARETEMLPGVSVFKVPGHTWGQQATRFTDEKGRTVVFVPDVMPTAWHLGQAYSLGYDVEPYTSMITRGWFLDEAARRDWLLVLDHEPGNPCQRVRANDRSWFDLVPDEA